MHMLSFYTRLLYSGYKNLQQCYFSQQSLLHNTRWGFCTLVLHWFGIHRNKHNILVHSITFYCHCVTQLILCISPCSTASSTMRVLASCLLVISAVTVTDAGHGCTTCPSNACSQNEAHIGWDSAAVLGCIMDLLLKHLSLMFSLQVL